MDEFVKFSNQLNELVETSSFSSLEKDWAVMIIKSEPIKILFFAGSIEKWVSNSKNIIVHL